MMMTYDFVFVAKQDKNFRSQIEKAILNGLNSTLYTNLHKLIFLPKSKTVLITARSDTSDFHEKIVPKQITYQALIKMLDGKWDSIDHHDITDLQDAMI